MNGSAWGFVMRLTASSAATRPGRPPRAASSASSAGRTYSDSYWPHHADTYQVAGHRRMAAAARTASFGRSRNHQTTPAAIPRSASTAGTFSRARMPASDESVTVRKAGSIAASAPQIQAMTAGKLRFWS